MPDFSPRTCTPDECARRIKAARARRAGAKDRINKVIKEYMKPKELDYVRCTVENEGFEYAFVGYSHFEEVKDEEFHALRKAYLKAREDLAKYLNIEIE